jgi:hypothetical protein
MTSQNFMDLHNTDVAVNFHSKIDQGAVQTSDATATTIWSVVIPEQTIATFFVLWSAIQDDHSEGGGGTIVATFRRDAGGNVTIVGAATVIDEDDSAGTITATMDADTGSQTARIRITGVAATVLDWAVTVIYQTRTT